MAQALMHDDEAAADLRRGLKYAERASGGSDAPTSAETAKAETKATTEAKKNAPGVGARAAYGAKAVGGAAVAGIEGLGHGVTEGAGTAWQGLKDLIVGTGPHAEDVGRGPLLEALSSAAGRVVGGGKIVAGLVQALSAPIGGAQAAAAKYMESLPKEHQDAVVLDSGAADLIRKAMGENTEGQAPGRDMTVKELVGHVAAAAVIAHGMNKGAGAKPGEAPKAAPAKPNAARFEAAAPVVEPPKPTFPAGGNAKAMEKFAADQQARLNWENAQKPAGEVVPTKNGPMVQPTNENALPPGEGAVSAADVALPDDIAAMRARRAALQPEAADAEPSAPGNPVAQAEAGTIEPGPAETAPVAEQPSSPLAAEAPATELPAEAKPVEGEQPPVEAAPAAEPSPVTPEEMQPVTPDPVVEAAAPAVEAEAAPPPPINTVADLHTAVQPHAEAPIAEAIQKVVADEATVREGANQLAQQMRAVGATRAQINEAYRAKLNEGGVFSKKQQAESAKLKAIDPAQASRGVAAAIMENPADPEPVIVNFLKKLGLPEAMAIDIADKTTEAMKKQLGEDGAGGIDLTKTENAPFDKVAANRSLAEKVRKLCP